MSDRGEKMSTAEPTYLRCLGGGSVLSAHNHFPACSFYFCPLYLPMADGEELKIIAKIREYEEKDWWRATLAHTPQSCFHNGPAVRRAVLPIMLQFLPGNPLNFSIEDNWFLHITLSNRHRQGASWGMNYDNLQRKKKIRLIIPLGIAV